MVAIYSLIALLGIAGTTTARVINPGALDFKVFTHRVTFGDSTVSEHPKISTVSARADKQIKTALIFDSGNEPDALYEIERGERKNRERRASVKSLQRRDQSEDMVGIPLREQYAAMIQATLEQYEDALLDPDNTNDELREEVRRFKAQFYEDE